MSRFYASIVLAVVVTLFVTIATFVYLGSSPSTQELDADLTAVQTQLTEADAEAAKYDAGLLLAFVNLRREVLKTTQAMLEQKRSSLLRRVNLKYTVASTEDGPATPEQLETIRADIAKAQAQLDAEKVEADKYSGGLLQTMAMMTVATGRVTVAMLNLSYYGAKYGVKLPALKLPPGPDGQQLNGTLRAVVGDTAVPSNEVVKNAPPIADPALAEKTEEEAKLEAMRTAWSVQSDVSPLDKSPRVILTRMSGTKSVDEVRSAGLLGLRCIEGNTSVVIGQSEYLGFSEQVTVDYRIGNNRPTRERWAVSGEHKIVYAPYGSKSVELIGQMQAADDFYVRISPESGDVKDFTFDLRGLNDHIAELKAACDWGGAKQQASKQITDRLDTGASTDADASTVETDAPQPTPVQQVATTPAQFVIQVGSKDTQTEALATFADMQRVYPTLLASYRPMVQKVDLGAKGIWYRLRIGPIDSKGKAIALCTKLKAQGHPDCLVMLAASQATRQ